MMKANEFRIGNLVHRKYPDRTEIDTVTGYDLWHSEKINDPKHLIEWNSISEIPLTEEWLRKFGFERKRSNIFSPKNCWHEYEWHLHGSKEEGNEWGYGTLSLQSKDVVVFATCKKVHHIQNLHFALIGEEL